MLEVKPFLPISGGSCVVYWKSVGAVPGSAVGATSIVFDEFAICAGMRL